MYLASRSALKVGDANANANANANTNANAGTPLGANDAREAMEIDQGHRDEAPGHGDEAPVDANADANPITSGDGDSINELKLILPLKFKSTNNDNISLGDYEGKVTYSHHYFHVQGYYVHADEYLGCVWDRHIENLFEVPLMEIPPNMAVTPHPHQLKGAA
ncbi:hypothetical protein VE02_06488 [Pseudogymnoascus sp. 03VT05]|nr:hypothetical protein VE02_06488 [Pseudogymnoascus sp. 03VT05]